MSLAHIISGQVLQAQQSFNSRQQSDSRLVLLLQQIAHSQRPLFACTKHHTSRTHNTSLFRKLCPRPPGGHPNAPRAPARNPAVVEDLGPSLGWPTMQRWTCFSSSGLTSSLTAARSSPALSAACRAQLPPSLRQVTLHSCERAPRTACASARERACRKTPSALACAMEGIASSPGLACRGLRRCRTQLLARNEQLGEVLAWRACSHGAARTPRRRRRQQRRMRVRPSPDAIHSALCLAMPHAAH